MACNQSGEALHPYILNQDISKWHFSPHSAVYTAPCLSRQCFPCGISLERAMRIDVSSANFRAKDHFQELQSEMPFSSANCRAKSYFQMSPSKMSLPLFWPPATKAPGSQPTIKQFLRRPAREWTKGGPQKENGGP